MTQGELSTLGGELVAGSFGVTLGLDGGAELHARAGTRFRIAEEPSALDPGAATTRSGRVLRLSSGALTVRLPRAAREAVLIEGPRRLRAAFESGELSLDAERDRVVVAAREGSARVAVGGRWRDLPGGIVQLVDAAHPAGVERTLLGAPAAPDPSSHLLLEGTLQSTAVRWRAVPGASGYEVQLRDASDGLILEQRSAEPNLSLGALPAGDHAVSVCAFDDTGLCGERSPPARLHVLGLSASPRLYRDARGTVRLTPGQRVSVLGAEGLELGYPGLDSFLPVPPTLGLVGHRKSSMLIRDPASGESIGLSLEPMTVIADIRLGQYAFGWPPEGLELIVSLRDADAQPLPDAFPVTVAVTLNVARLELPWEREGDVLRSFVDRPDGVGPWMLRVEVFDESGLSLGKNVTEIAYRVPPSTR